MFDCPVCGRTDVNFKRIKRRPNAICRCGSRERHRAAALVLTHEGIHSPEVKQIMHLSSLERALARFVFHNRPQNMRAASGNLLQLHQLHEANSLDFIIHNHVMEHIKPHEAAFEEQVRILKPGGKLVFTVPVRSEDGKLLDKTVEFDHKLSQADRRKFYGQHDHVRYYGKQDMLDVLDSCGFKAVYRQAIEICGEDRAAKCSLKPGHGAVVAVKL